MRYTQRSRLPLALVFAFLLALVGSVGALAQVAQGSGTITLTTQPEAGAIVPDEIAAPTKFIIEARGPQGPLRNALIDFEITAPTFGPLVSSDIPAVEGTTLFKSRFAAPEGRLEFDYVVPIRGTYKVKLQALPGSGATFQPITQEVDLNVRERGSEVVYFWGLVAVLVALGVGAGAVLGYFNRGARAAG